MDLERLTAEKKMKLLACQEKCVWRIILTQFMGIKLPIDCPDEKVARTWLRKTLEEQRDRNSGLI